MENGRDERGEGETKTVWTRGGLGWLGRRHVVEITDSKATACAYLTCSIQGGTIFRDNDTQGQREVKQQQSSENA